MEPHYSNKKTPKQMNPYTSSFLFWSFVILFFTFGGLYITGHKTISTDNALLLVGLLFFISLWASNFLFKRK